MDRWKSVIIVAAVVGAIGLGVTLRPKPASPQSADASVQNAAPASTLAPTGAPREPIAAAPRQSPVLPAPNRAVPSSRPVPTVVAKPAAALPSPPAPPATPLAEPSAQNANVAATATPTPTVPEPASTATGASSASSPQAPATATRKGPVTITLKKDAVIGIRLDQAISSENAKVEDKISAKVSRDVVVDGTTAIPAGARLEGAIVMVERPSKANPHGKIGIKFTTLVRADNSRVAIATDMISREASDPSANAGAAFDAKALGLIVDPVRRPGATGSPAPKSSTSRDLQIPAGAYLTVHLTAPLSISIDRDPE